MIKRFLPDIFIAGVILALAFFIAAGSIPSAPASSAPREKPVVQSTSAEKKIWLPPVASDSALKERNLFSESGSYTAPVQQPKKVAVVLPENPYTLVAVLLGKEQKAVFRNYTGEIQTLTAGKALIDGAVIAQISPRSVKVKKGKKIKELSLFDVHLKSPEGLKKKSEPTKLGAEPMKSIVEPTNRGAEPTKREPGPTKREMEPTNREPEPAKHAVEPTTPPKLKVEPVKEPIRRTRPIWR